MFYTPWPRIHSADRRSWSRILDLLAHVAYLQVCPQASDLGLSSCMAFSRARGGTYKGPQTRSSLEDMAAGVEPPRVRKTSSNAAAAAMPKTPQPKADAALVAYVLGRFGMLGDIKRGHIYMESQWIYMFSCPGSREPPHGMVRPGPRTSCLYSSLS